MFHAIALAITVPGPVLRGLDTKQHVRLSLILDFLARYYGWSVSLSGRRSRRR